ncbi:MAG: hypothetical protein IJV26_08870, partial [Lachnospiraceae bacterium]|nr:hypothetical protein [Lachnospiraceae bacterium]
ELVLKSADAQKEYDGTALTTKEQENTGITVSGDGFAEGEGFKMEAQGSQLLPGSSVNSISYEPLEGTKEENYRIRVDEGTLTVTDRVEPFRITVTGNSGDVLYDGAEHSVEGLKETEFRISGRSYTVEGLDAAVSGTDAGTYTGTISGTAKILDADGNDVTGQFVVTGTAGTLQIRRRSLVLTSADAEKVYDGRVLTTADAENGGITVSGDGFAENEGAVYTVTGSQLLAGSSDNIFTYQLSEGTKAENYEIEVHMGLLRVTDRSASERYEITVIGQSAEALYDGADHSAEGIVTDTFTVEGRTYTVSGLSGSRTERNAGTYEVPVTGAAVVRDGAGNDVTDQFNVRTQPGTLTIQPREVILTSADAEKEYDGTALTTENEAAQGITVSGDGFAAGEGASYTVSGSQTLVGVSSNTFTYELNEGTEEANYRITVVPGTLSVTGRTTRIAITAEAVGAEAVYDGEVHTAEGLAQTVFTFNGHTYTLSGLESSVSGTDAGTYLASVTGTAKVTDENGNDVTDQFAVSLQSAELRILPAPLTIRTGSAQKAYDGTALTAAETEITGLQGSDQISVLVTGTQTVPGSTQNTCEISWGETKPSNYQVELQPGTLQVSANAAQVVLRAADASKIYDGTELKGTAEVTAEGLPAGFSAEIETEGSLTDAGTASNHITGYVIYNAAGEDNSSFFTNVQTMDGVLRIHPRKVTITSASAEKVYDGKELTTVDEPAQGITVSGDGFAEGEGAEYTVTGTQTLTGMSPNTFSYTLAEGTAAGNYEITQSFGTLTVKNRAADEKYQITAKAMGGSYLYDGAAHTVQGLVTNTFTVDGQTYTLEGLTASRTERNAGVYEIALGGTPLVRDADDNDVTEEFSVGAESGTLRIRPRSVTITSADAGKEYDGTALTTAELENAGITESGDGFAAGEGAAYTVTGSQTIPGESENTFTYRLNAGTEEANYNITVQTGTLTVTDRSEKIHVTLQTAGGSFLYDGEEHTVQGLTTEQITVDGVVYTITGITCEETQTDAGTYPVKAEGELKILDADCNDVTDQFDPEILEGSLQILPRE